MSTSNVQLTHNEICSILAASRTFRDPRVSALITLILAFGLSRAEVCRLRWMDFDQIKLTLRLRNNLMLCATELLARQLLAIPRRGHRIFSVSEKTQFQLDSMLNQVLAATNLSDRCWNDLAAWSKSQSAQTRNAVATA